MQYQWKCNATYINPMEKMAEMPIFRSTFICRCHMAQMGSTRMQPSLRTLMAPIAIRRARMSMHRPVVNSGSQIFVLGRHSRAKASKEEE